MPAKMTDRALREHADRLAIEVAREHGLAVESLLFSQHPGCIKARRELFWRCRQLRPQPSYAAVADAIGFDVATVRHSIQGCARVVVQRCPDCGKRQFRGFCSAACALGKRGAV